ncbi:MAG: sigma-54 dependent transcriptional regulator [Muribaculaceae bacterium]|nr:sigma-54 dependent transcriptional regulator [Muribaculaceae bacterium]MDE6165071.1 sigma-54 dependent transcriptional regulator [Muribaculaceae bacterium]
MQIDISQLSPEAIQARNRFGIVGNDSSLNAAVERALRVAPIDLSVLVAGESGSGKEFFPRIIHSFSPRKHAKYIAVNCGAIPEGTIDSELFGHEKGAFTGAVTTRKGYFEEADGGTIFLDEVAELPLTTQARLLRVLESGEFLKVGSSTVQTTDIRVVAATNVDMLKAVREGRFREDLYYRLSTVQISVPPLRERGLDIVMLAVHFARDFGQRYRVPAVSFDESGRHVLLGYSWPGNVRQLKNVVEQMSLFEAGNVIDAEIVGRYLPAVSRGDFSPVAVHDGSSRYEHEREMLFSMILKLQHELDELRAELEVGRSSGQPHVAHGAFRHPIVDLSADEVDNVSCEAALCQKVAPVTQALAHYRPYESALQVGDVADVRRKAAQLSEKEMIEMALERHAGRRKAAAAELNISERTLYRKIREYGIE